MPCVPSSARLPLRATKQLGYAGDHKPDLRVILNWMIAHSGSVITDVLPLKFLLIR